MTARVGAPSLLAAALGAPDLQVRQSVSVDRWRAPLGDAAELVLGPNDIHKRARLQVLRRVLDLQPDGRWSLTIPVEDHAELLGPLHRAQGTPVCLADCLASWPHPLVLRRLFLWVDGRRVDQQLEARFPGARPDIALDPAPPLPATLQHLASATGPWPDALDSLREAVAAYQHLRAGRPVKARSGASTGDRLLEAPDDGNDGHQQRLQRYFSNGRLGDDAKAGEPAGANSGDRATEHSATPDLTGDGAPSQKPGLLNQPVAIPWDPAASDTKRPSPHTDATGVCHYDEWDHVTRVFRAAWVAVREHRVQGDNTHYRSSVLAKHPTIARQIKAHLAQVRAAAASRQHRLKEGDQIDVAAALEQVVGRRLGQRSGEDFIYQSQAHRGRELSVLVLLDISASTGYPVRAPRRDTSAATESAAQGRDDVFWQSDPSPVHATPPRRVIDVLKDAVALLCEALNALGDRHAVLAFSGMGRQNVDVSLVKDFDDAWSAATAAALDTLQPKGSTRTGAAVRHATARLRVEPQRKKLLLVLSDGYPQDTGYGYEVNDIEYGVRDTAHALNEARRAGIDAFNVSVDVAATDYLSRMCPKNRYWVINDVAALPGKMMDLCRLVV